jgi:predicted alpha/beta superfamily hydrolase
MTRTQLRSLFKALLLFISAVVSLAQNKGESVSYGQKFSLSSSILNEDRRYWVNLPASYDDPRFSPQRYPVRFLFDAKSSFFPVCGVLNFMSGPESVNYQVPEMITVGIDNDNRLKDVTPNSTNKNMEGVEEKVGR